MTRDEFIDEYLARPRWSRYRTEMGFCIPGVSPPRVALPCNCGEEVCPGWAMVPDDDLNSVEDHLAKCANDPRAQAALDEYRARVKR